MVGRFSPRSRVKDGDDVEVAVDTRSLHFFDPETGLGIYDDNLRKEPHEQVAHRPCCSRRRDRRAHRPRWP